MAMITFSSTLSTIRKHHNIRTKSVPQHSLDNDNFPDHDITFSDHIKFFMTMTSPSSIMLALFMTMATPLSVATFYMTLTRFSMTMASHSVAFVDICHDFWLHVEMK